MKKRKLICLIIILFFNIRGTIGLANSNFNGGKQTDSSYQELKKLLNHSLASHDDLTAASCNEKIGDIFLKEGALPQALEYYLKAYNIFHKNKEVLGTASNLNKIGRIYYKHNRLKKASSYFRSALPLYLKKDDKKGIGQTYGNIGLTFEKEGKLDSAYHYQQLALSSFQLLRDESHIVETFTKIGGIYEDMKKYDSALSFYLMAYQRSINDQNKSNFPALLNNIGDTYRKMGKFSIALTYTKRAEQLAFKLKNNVQLSSAHRDLAKTFYELARYDSAYYYSEKAREAYAKTFNQNNDKQLNLLQTLFDVQQKNNEIKALNNEKHLNSILIAFSFSLCILLATLGYFIYSKQVLKNKNEHLLFQTAKEAMALEIERKNRALSSFTLHMIQKNEFLGQLTQRFDTIIKDDKRDQRKELKQLISLINDNTNLDQTWEDFRKVYEEVHENFFDKLKAVSNALTSTDLRFLALAKMNLNSQEIATMLGISPDSLRSTRYRIRKKLQLQENETLLDFLNKL